MGRCCCCCCGNSINTETGKAIAGLATAVETIVATANAPFVIPVKNVVFDQGNFFDANGKVQINSDGVYLVTGEISYKYENGAKGTRWAGVKKNGTSYLTGSVVAPNGTSAGMEAVCAIIAKLNKGDYLELVGNISTNSSAVVVETTISPETSKMSIARLGD